MLIKPKKVLLCDASFNVIKILKQLKKRGLHVSVCGSRPSDPCHALADQSFVFDYSNNKQLLKIVKKNKIDYLIPGCTDISYFASSWVANRLDLPGYDSAETTDIIHNKYKFREFLAKEGHPSPKFIKNLSLIHTLKFPFLIKPVSSYSGRGILKVNNKSELKTFLKKNSKKKFSGEYIAEEFVSGQLYSISAFVRNSKIAKHFFVKEYCTVFPYQVNSSNLDTKLSSKIKKNIQVNINLICEKLSLSDGLLHIQFISDNKSFAFIEAARRCPGDLYGELIERATKENYYDYYLRPFCSISILPNKKNNSKTYVSRHTLSINNDSIFLSSFVNCSSYKLSVTNYQLKSVGQILKAAPYDRAAIFFVEYKSFKAMDIITKNLFKYINAELMNIN
jgi:biotin carboxylase